MIEACLTSGKMRWSGLKLIEAVVTCGRAL